MRKFYSLLMMFIVAMLSFGASAGTVSVTIDIDNPDNVILYQGYPGESNYTEYSLHEGSNSLSLSETYGGRTAFKLKLVGNAQFESITVNGTPENLEREVYNGEYSGYVAGGSTVVVRTSAGSSTGGGEGGNTTHTVTITVNDASNVGIYKNEYREWDPSSTKVSLQDGTHTYEFNSATDYPLLIQSVKGNNVPMASVKLNTEEIGYVQNDFYRITPVDGDVITIDSNTVKYTLSFAPGCNISAVSNVTLYDSNYSENDLTGWQSGSVELEAGTRGYIYFDNNNYTISDITIGGESKTDYGYGVYYEMTRDMEVSFTATAKGGGGTGGNDPVVTDNTVTFTLSGWEGNTDDHAFILYDGNSEWNSTIDYTETPFEVTFTNDEADPVDPDYPDIIKRTYLIKVTGDYRISSITINGRKTNATVYSSQMGGTVKVANGDNVVVTLTKYVDPYTATLTVNVDHSDYNGNITIKNGTGHVNSTLFDGTNTFKFDPNNASDRNFTITSNQDLYSVKRGESTLTGPTSFTLNGVTDGETVTIVATNPADVKYCDIVFGDDCDYSAVDVIAVGGVDLDPSDWNSTYKYTAKVGQGFLVRFKPGYAISNLVFGEGTYNYVPGKSNQPLDCYGTYYQFSHTIDEEVEMAFSFERSVMTYEDEVTFNVNIPAGVKITDLRENPDNIVVSEQSFTHNFTSEGTREYIYIDIDAAEGYELKSVTHASSEGTREVGIHDNKVSYLELNDGDTVTIEVEESATEPEFGIATVTVIGDPAKITFKKGRTEIALEEGTNPLTLEAEETNFKVEANPGDVISITVNDTEIEGTYDEDDDIVNYSLKKIKAKDEIVITTKGATAPTFTLTVIGDPMEVTMFNTVAQTYIDKSTLIAGDNPIDLGSNASGVLYYLMGNFYSVKLNGEMVTTSGSYYEISIKAGDVLELNTVFPDVDYTINWSFTGCDASIIKSISIDYATALTPDDEEFAAYFAEGGFTVKNGQNVAYSFDTTNYTINSVYHNGNAQLTGGNNNFNVSENTTIYINATPKRKYNCTLNVDMPEGVYVYQGEYGMGQNAEIGYSTSFEINEVTGATYLTIGCRYGYFFDEDNCKMDNVKLEKVSGEAYYKVYPQENSVINISIKGVERPYSAVLYIHSPKEMNYVTLVSGRYEGYTSPNGVEGGHHLFKFNNEDLGDGFTLNIGMKEEGATAKVYINDVPQNLNTETMQLTNIMLKDGDVVKVYSEEPKTHNLTFSLEDDAKFTVTIDRVKVYEAPRARILATAALTSSINALSGTEITLTADESTTQPWVIANGEFTRLKPGESFTYTVDGDNTDHMLRYGDSLIPTGVESVLSDGNGSADIYTLQGVCIKRGASAGDIKNLAPGLYIIGGHKVYVK